MYPTCEYTHATVDWPAPEDLSFEQLIKVTSGPEMPWRWKIPPADASHTPLLKHTPLMSASNLSSHFLQPSFPLSHFRLLFICRKEGHCWEEGVHSVLKSNKWTFLLIGAQEGKERRGAHLRTQMSSWQCTHTHTHTSKKQTSRNAVQCKVPNLFICNWLYLQSTHIINTNEMNI